MAVYLPHKKLEQSSLALLSERRVGIPVVQKRYNITCRGIDAHILEVDQAQLAVGKDVNIRGHEIEVRGLQRMLTDPLTHDVHQFANHGFALWRESAWPRIVIEKLANLRRSLQSSSLPLIDDYRLVLRQLRKDPLFFLRLEVILKSCPTTTTRKLEIFFW